MKTAICDTDAIYPFRDLVEGRFHNLANLIAVERFVRTVVLHDETAVQITPMALEEESEAEAEYQHRLSGETGARMVIVGFAPILSHYEFLSSKKMPGVDSSFSLSQALTETINKFSNASPGNAFNEAHVEFARRALSIVQNGSGSALLCSEFGREIIGIAERYPYKLFEHLDQDWQKFANEIESDRLGFQVPPILAIVLSRCARREAIPTVLKDLRDEWANARRKTWNLLDALRSCKTIGDALAIKRELAEASLLFSPDHKELRSRPGRMLWEIGGSAVAGAIGTSLAGGNALVGGALTAAATQAPKAAVSLLHEFRQVFFNVGAFDLANKVRREVTQVEIDALIRLLRPDEINSLR